MESWCKKLVKLEVTVLTLWSRRSDSLVNSKQGFGPGVPGSIPSSSKNFVLRNTIVGFESRR